jgi:serine/threonine protein kinase/tetratricopeptide (TPR) repeat protein
VTHAPALLFGRYQLLDRIALGGMAEVYRAKSYGVEGFEKAVVVKRMLPALAHQQAFVDAYLREARMAVSLSHAHVVQVFDLGREDDTYFVAQEHVTGVSLDELIARSRRRGLPIPLDLCVLIGAGLTRGLDYAHRRKDAHGKPLGILHRGVSPRSVLVSNEGEVKLGHFGIAAARRILEQAGTLRARPQWVAPETLRDGVEDVRSDLYGVGLTLYAAVTGRNPFVLESGATEELAVVIERVLRAEVAPVEALRPEVSPELAAVIARAMDRDPARRFASAAEIYEELTSILYLAQRRVGSNDLGTWLRTLAQATTVPPSRAPSVDPGPMLELDAEAPAEDDVEAIEVDDEVAEVAEPIEVAEAIEMAEPIEMAEAIEVAEALEMDAEVAPLDDAEVAFDVEPEGVSADDVLSPFPERRDLAVLAVVGAIPSAEAALDAMTEAVLGRGAVILQREPQSLVCALGAPGTDADDATRAAALALSLRARLGARSGAALGWVEVTLDRASAPVLDGTAETALAALRTLALQASKAGAVWASEDFVEEIAADFDVQGTAPGGRVVAGPREGVRRKVAGRKEPFGLLAEQLSMVATQGARLVTVRGDEGIGKTRFLAEVDYRLRRMNHPVLWFGVSCTPATRGTPLGGLQLLLRTLLSIEEGDAESVVRAKARRVRELGLTPDEMLALGAVLGVVSAAVDIGDAARRTLRASLEKIVGRLVGDKVAVLALDRGEHLDDASEALFDDLAQSSDPARLLLVVAAETGRRFAWEERARHLEIVLDPLVPEELRQLTATLLGASEVSPALLEALWARSGGVPRVAEALLRQGERAGVVRVEGGVAVADVTLLSEATPWSVRAGILGRLGRLPGFVRRIVQAASVVGPRFAAEQVAGLAEMDDATARQGIDVLLSQGIVARGVEGAMGGYTFVLPLRARVVEQALVPAVRQALRSRVASVSEARLGARVDAFADTLAEHLLAAGDRPRALGFLERAARRQLESGAFDAAVATLTRAIEVAEDDRDEALGRTLGRYLTLASAGLGAREVDPALTVLRRGASVAASQDDRGTLGHLTLGVGRLLARRSAGAEALKTLERAGLHFDRVGDRPAKALSLVAVGAVYADRAEYGRAMRALSAVEEALRGAEAPERARWLLTVARCRAAGAEIDRAQECVEAAAATIGGGARTGALGAELARVRAEVLLASGDLAGAAQAAEVALARSRADDKVGLAASALLAAVVAWRSGRPQEAAVWLREGYDAAAARSIVRYTARCSAWLAFLARARDTLEAAQAAVDAEGYTGDALEVRLLGGLLAVESGELERGRRAMREVKMKAGATDNRVLAEACEQALRGAFGGRA